jgi:putative sterol carrier protein
MARARPPADISPEEFFTRWVPETVDTDVKRRGRLRNTRASIVFEITGAERSVFTVQIADGQIRGVAGTASDPDLHVEVDDETWRALNRGDLGAPEALLRRRLKVRGDFVLALKLQLILG